ncbi:hypothetical protein Hamer_G024607 [Homarus americanus]|uniref:Uncharacterized protein n=1 Tax=Homarus americanus TaxID=6706 RepID=A0A8J5TV50_HOMAM|nr:hypothetical protein Hamer_G024607 [Homarus americanus]
MGGHEVTGVTRVSRRLGDVRRGSQGS